MMEELTRFLSSQGGKGKQMVKWITYDPDNVSAYKAAHEMMRRVRYDAMTAARLSRRRE